MGTARSGSTILGVAMGNHDGVFYAGEVGGWLVRSGVTEYPDSGRQAFWDAVREQVDGAELYGSHARSCLEESRSVLALHRWRERRSLRGCWQRVTHELYRRIADVSGSDVVVDTSSHPLRARELQRMPEIDLHLVYLVREPHGVVESFTGPRWTFSRSLLKVNAYIWLTNLLCTWVFLRHPRGRRIFMRYERFIAAPESALAALMRGVRPMLDGLPDLLDLDTGAPFQGNLLLYERRVALRRVAPPAARRWPTAVVQLPWALPHALLYPRVTRPPATDSPGGAAPRHARAAARARRWRRRR